MLSRFLFIGVTLLLIVACNVVLQEGERLHNLVIEAAQFADAGVYTCRGAGDEASVMLNITTRSM